MYEYIFMYTDGTEERVPTGLFKGTFIARRHRIASYRKVKKEVVTRRSGIAMAYAS